MLSSTSDDTGFWINKFFGNHPFSITVSLPIGGGRPWQLKISVSKDDDYLADPTAPSHDVDPAMALRFLVDNWKDIAGIFTVNGSQSAVVDLSRMFSEGHPRVTGIKPLVMTRTGPYVGFPELHREPSLGKASVTVTECLLRLGQIFATAVKTNDPSLALQWKILALNTDLLPANPESFDGRQAVLEPDYPPVVYYARLMGMKVDDYRTLAIVDQIGRDLEGEEDTGLPGIPETDFTERQQIIHLPAEFQTGASLNASLRMAAFIAARSVDDIVRDGIRAMNEKARELVVINRWYGTANTNG